LVDFHRPGGLENIHNQTLQLLYDLVYPTPEKMCCYHKLNQLHVQSLSLSYDHLLKPQSQNVIKLLITKDAYLS